jgi:hypothetical protein
MRRIFFTILATFFITSSGCTWLGNVGDRAAADYSHVTSGSDSEYIRSGGKHY